MIHHICSNAPSVGCPCIVFFASCVLATAGAWLWSHAIGDQAEARGALVIGAVGVSIVVVVAVLRLFGTGRSANSRLPCADGRIVAEVPTSARYAAGHDAFTGPCSCGAWHKDGA